MLTIVPWAEEMEVDERDREAVVAAIAGAVERNHRPDDPRLFVIPAGWAPPGRWLTRMRIPIVWPEGWPLLAEVAVKLARLGDAGDVVLLSQSPAKLAPGAPYPRRHERIRAFEIAEDARELPAEWFQGAEYPHPGERLGERVATLMPDRLGDGSSPEQLWALCFDVAADLVEGGAGRAAEVMAELNDAALRGLALTPADTAAAAAAMRASAACVVDARRTAGWLGVTPLESDTPRVPAMERLAALADAARPRLSEAASRSLEGLDAVASAVSVEHLEAQRRESRVQAERAAADASFQRVVTFVGAFVLIPGLVAGVYGADVVQPAEDSTRGLFVLVSAMSATGLLSLWGLRAIDEAHDDLRWTSGRHQLPLLAAGAALVLIAILIALLA